MTGLWRQEDRQVKTVVCGRGQSDYNPPLSFSQGAFIDG